MPSVDWRVRFLPVKGGSLCFLGKWQVGVVRRTEGDSSYRYPHWVAHVNLPGMVGPVTRESEEHAAKLELTIKVKEWLTNLSTEPSLACTVSLATGATPTRAKRTPRASLHTEEEPLRLRRSRSIAPPPLRTRRVR